MIGIRESIEAALANRGVRDVDVTVVAKAIEHRGDTGTGEWTTEGTVSVSVHRVMMPAQSEKAKRARRIEGLSFQILAVRTVRLWPADDRSADVDALVESVVAAAEGVGS